jgi:hypothetical protein
MPASGLLLDMLADMTIFLLIVVALFLGILIALETGWRIRARQLATETEHSEAGLAALDGAVFGLMGLMIAFTFSGAAARFDARRALIVEETNDIGTAYLRIDLLPKEAQPALRESFRNYVDARLEFYKKIAADPAAARGASARATELQGEIWKQAVAVTPQTSTAVTSLVISSLNDMIDITTKRAMALETHPPMAIYIALAVLVMASAVLAGYGMGKSGRRDWTHMLIYSATLAFAVYLILDIEYPRFGVVKIERADHIMLELRESMK